MPLQKLLIVFADIAWFLFPWSTLFQLASRAMTTHPIKVSALNFQEHIQRRDLTVEIVKLLQVFQAILQYLIRNTLHGE